MEPPHTPFAASLARLARRFYRRGWLPATSGNLSVRVGPDEALITASGRDKGRLGPGDFLTVDLDGTPRSAPPGARPSAETLLHTSLYAADPAIGAVLHVHAPGATVLSLERPGGVVLRGYELLKAFPGVVTHEVEVTVPVFPNEQHMPTLAARVAATSLGVPGYLIAGHGLYAFGADLAAAERHVEAFEFLFSCELWRRR